MNETIFSGTAIVELQGEEALQLLEMDIQHATYRVLGFDQLKVFITDHRTKGVDAVHEAVEKGNVRDFAQRFSSPAYVLVIKNINSSIMIDLYETTDTNLSDMLWIVVGMPGSMPIYNYYYYHFEPIGQDLYAILSIYSTETDAQPEFPLASTSVC